MANTLGTKFHGIRLAASSFITNLVAEPLVADPLPITGGRLWFNTVQKVIKYSVYDAGGAVIVKTINDAEGAAAALSQLQSDLAAEVTARGVAVTAESTARAAAIAALTAALTTETNDRIAGDATEAADRTAAVAVAAATASDQLATETTARLAGDAASLSRDNALQAELDATQTGAGLQVDGTYVAPQNTTYLGATTSLRSAATTLDAALSAEVTDRTAAVAAVQASLDSEVQTRTSDVANLQTQLTSWVTTQLAGNAASDAAEVAARIAGDSALQTELNRTQASIGTAVDGALIPFSGTSYLDAATTIAGAETLLDIEVKRVSDAVVAEASARSTANTNFNTLLNTEMTDRAAADAAIQAELNLTQVGSGLETTGAYAAPTGSNYLGTAISLKDADFVLDAAVMGVQTQVTANTTNIANLNTAIATEVTNRTNADASVTSALNAEVSRATAAEVAVAADLATEVSDRAAAVTSVAGALSTEITNRTTADAGLQTQIDAVVAASGSGAAALKTQLNATRHNFTSVSGALTHTVVHNLNTQFLIIDVKVQGDDSVFVNDIMPIVPIDSNSYSVILNEARNIIACTLSNAAL